MAAAVSLLCVHGAASAAAPTPPGWQVLFRDDFESGDARNWLTEHLPGEGPSWEVERQGNNFVFTGKRPGAATLDWGWAFDYRVKLRFNLVRGVLVVNFRASTCRKYYVTVDQGSAALRRTSACGVTAELIRMFGTLSLGSWHTLEILALGPSLKVYINETLRIDYTDSDPVLFGGLALQSWPDGLVHVDEVEVAGPPSAGEPAWVKTGGPLGGLGYDVRMRPDNPDVMFVTDTWSGVNMSTDGGRTWFASNLGIHARLGPSGDAIPIFCLTIDPHNPDVIWVGTQGTRSLFKSSDGGKTWVQKDKGISEPVDTAFRGITVDPRNPSVIYAAAEVPTERGVGHIGKRSQLVGGVVYRSSNGGESWVPIWRGNNLARYVLLDPRNADVIYISTGIFDREARDSDAVRDWPGGHGIVKSTDGGRTWRDLNERNGLLNRYVGSLFMHPSNPDLLLAAAGSNPYSAGSGVYLSTDGGERWERTLGTWEVGPGEWEIMTAVEFALSDPSIAYAAGPRGFYRSRDGGRTWTAMAGGSKEDGSYGPPGVRVGFPIDLQVDPRNPDRVFINNYAGGNFLSEDGGRSWVVANQGYTGAQVPDLAVAAGRYETLLAIAKSGIFRSDDAGGHWEGLHSPLFAMDPWYTGAVDPRDPQRLLVSEQHNGRVYRSRNGGRDWAMVFDHPGADTSKPVAFWQGVKSFAFAPSNPGVLYAGMCREAGALARNDPGGSFGIYRSTDAGETWAAANDALSEQQDINVLAVDPRSENIVYAGTFKSGVLRTLDGGRTWQARNNGLPVLDVRALAIDPSNPLVVYAGLENGGVYKTEDAGGRWVAAGFGMDPQAVIRDIVVDPTSPQTVYAADFHTGVYRSSDGGKLWRQINRGLRTRAVNALAISEDGGTLYAATEGEGVFRLDLKPRAEAVVTAVSAASFAKDAPLAPDSIASLFGRDFADPTVVFTDSGGADLTARLFAFTATQINCLVPAGLKTGPATVRALQQNRVVARGQVRIEPVAPGLFTANADGKGAPAAVALRIAADGSQTPLPVSQCAATCAPVAIDLGAETDQVILLLFGTGIRHGKQVSVRIGGLEAPVLGWAAQGQFAGLDQVNVRLPRALAGCGEVDVVLTVDGKAANVVKMRIQ
jgi:uncharacterized protein (TIGR03437 family)